MPGLGTAFFSVRYVTFFSVLKKKRSVLFRSFLEFLATYETLQRTERNAKNATFFCTERKRTRERFILLKKNARTFRSFFNIYIDI